MLGQSLLEQQLLHVQPALEIVTCKTVQSKQRSFSFPGGGVRAFYQFGVAEAMRAKLGDALKDCDLYGT